MVSGNPHNARRGGVAVFLSYHITGDVKAVIGLRLQKKKKKAKDTAMIRRGKVSTGDAHLAL